MSEPRQHHYIPRFYLSGFVDPRILRRESRETLWVYERGQGPRTSSPEKEARQRDFYTYLDGAARNTSVEEWLSVLEHDVAPIIKSVRQARRNITDSEKELLALFVGIMRVRTPAQRRLGENRINPFVNKMLKEAAADASTFPAFFAKNYDPAYMENFDPKDRLLVEALRQAILDGNLEQVSSGPDFELSSMIEVGKKIGVLLLEMNWQLLRSEREEPFLTSDDPVINFVMDEHRNKLFLRQGEEQPGVKVFFPLCSEICVLVARDRQPGHGCWTSRAAVRALNKLIIMSADRWVYASERSNKIKFLLDRKGGKHSVDTEDFRYEGRKY